MDSTIQAGINTVITNQFTYFFQGEPTFKKADGTAQIIQGSTIMGYVGGALAFFLSAAGVYSAGSHLIKELETSFFAFLEDFQDNDDYIALLDDEDVGKKMHDFLIFNAWDTLIMMLAIFFHCFVLLGTGWTVAFMIINNINTLWTADNSSSTGNIPIDKGWKMLIFGLVFGGIDYIAGWAVSVNKTTILEMIGFHAHEVTKNTVYTTTTTTPQFGTITESITSAKTYERKKDLWALNEILEEWPTLFYSQKFVQIVLPYCYLAMLDSIVSMAFFFVVMFMEK